MKLIIAVGGGPLMALLGRYPQRLIERVTQALNRLSIEIQSTVKGEKLSGQVLHVRTGTLRRSINREVRRVDYGVEAIIGTNVAYAAVHEYGFQGTETVKAHLRTIRQVWGRPIPPKRIQVSAFSRRVNIPERSFLRSTLKEYEQRAIEALQRAAAEAVTR